MRLPEQLGWNVRLHPNALTPDPTYGEPVPRGNGLSYSMDVFPWKLTRCVPEQAGVRLWGARLDGAQDPGTLELSPTPDGRLDLTLDFGTELEGRLELTIATASTLSLLTLCGEFPLEVEEPFPSCHPHPQQNAFFAEAGTHAWHGEQRGFRFVRLVFRDLRQPVAVRAVKAQGHFVFRDRPGDFQCDDRRFQRAWQTSVYTARLCTRPDTIWDGIKRDRGGWFGDARIIKNTIDCVYHDPRPSRAMLASLAVDQWANKVPVYSFDAIAMLHDHILAFGLDEEAIGDSYNRIASFLSWVADSQVNGDGFIVRDASQRFFGDIGFLDWSAMPVGGRFEELSWLQCKHVEGLRTAGQIARWLGRDEDAAVWEDRAARIGRRIIEVFWRPGKGFVHTLNHVGPVPNPHVPGYGGHYRKTYEEGVRLGESGPSRQCNALAVLAGIADADMRRSLLREVFDSPAIEPIVTAYFLYFEQMARAACGDAPGAVSRMASYVADMLEDRDAATLIEMHDPRVHDFRKFCNHFEVTWTWPLSYCHGWGAGLVPLAQRHLLGLRPVAPGWARLVIDPPTDFPLAFRAVVPTPRGVVTASRDGHSGPIRYVLPTGIELAGEQPADVIVEQL